MLILPLLAMCVPCDFPVRVETLDGRRLSGALVAMDADQLLLETPRGPESLPRGGLLHVTSQAATDNRPTLSPRSVLVELIDGSLIAAAEYEVASGRAAVEFATGDRMQLSTNLVRTVRLRPADPALDAQWKALIESTAAGDLIAIRKSSDAEQASDAQQPVTVLDPVEGTLADVAGDQVTFEYDGSRIDVPKSRIEGLIYHRPQTRTFPEPIGELVARNGSRWMARSLLLETGADEGVLGGVLAIITPAGVRRRVPLEELERIDFSLGNLDYLDELPLESADFRPHFRSSLTPDTVSSWFRPRTFRDSVSVSSVAGMSECQRGLSLHSRTQLTYRLRKEYSRLRATVGFDQRFREEGQVRLLIEGSNRVLFDQEIRGTDDPLQLDVDVRGVRRLAILVDFGADGSDLGDQLILCNARLTK